MIISVEILVIKMIDRKIEERTMIFFWYHESWDWGCI